MFFHAAVFFSPLCQWHQNGPLISWNLCISSPSLKAVILECFKCREKFVPNKWQGQRAVGSRVVAVVNSTGVGSAPGWTHTLQECFAWTRHTCHFFFCRHVNLCWLMTHNSDQQVEGKQKGFYACVSYSVQDGDWWPREDTSHGPDPLRVLCINENREWYGRRVKLATRFHLAARSTANSYTSTPRYVLTLGRIHRRYFHSCHTAQICGFWLTTDGSRYAQRQRSRKRLRISQTHRTC